MIDFSHFDTLLSMITYFRNEDICKKVIIETRWGAGKKQDIVCPYCGEHHCATRKGGNYRCNHCKRNFTFKVGTIFENSKLPLVKWFIAMYLISSHKKGISSCQLARDMKATQKTAWYILHKVRALYAQDDTDVFRGEVECDEHLQAYIDEACFRWNTRKMDESGRFTHMFRASIGLVKTYKDFVLCNKVA